MKKFLMAGKWSAVILLGIGLLFAGCMGPSSSDDSAIPAKAGGIGAQYVYKFSVDPQAGKLDIEPVVMGTALSTTHFGGLMDVSANGTCVGYPLVCQITFKNLTPAVYMAQMRTIEYGCLTAGCTAPTTATLNTNDYGSPIIANGTGGQCIANDGAYGDRIFTIATACPTYMYYSDPPDYTGTLQWLHPECGSMTDTWTFGNESNPYQFYTTLVNTAAATTIGSPFAMYPEAGNAGNDARFSADRTTFVVQAYNLDNTWSGTQTVVPLNSGCASNANTSGDGYLLGAPQCSTPIADGQTLAPGQYFAVNMGFEWPDRIENQNHGMRCKMTVTVATGPCNQTGLSCNEWPNSLSILYTFDPLVLEAVTVPTTSAGGTVIAVTAEHEVYKESTPATSKKGYADMNDGMNSPPSYQASIGNNNYVFIARAPVDGAFQFKTTLYNTVNCYLSARENVARAWLDPRPIATVGAVPNFAGNAGAYGWTGLAEMYQNGTKCDFHDLAQDAAVDYWMALQYMRVKPTAAAGSGSIIKIEPLASNTTLQWFGSNCTRGGGMTGDDITSWFWPCTGNPCTGTGSGAVTSAPTGTAADRLNVNTVFYEAQEVSNKSLPGGVNTEGGKGYQINNDHICVTGP